MRPPVLYLSHTQIRGYQKIVLKKKKKKNKYALEVIVKKMGEHNPVPIAWTPRCEREGCPGSVILREERGLFPARRVGRAQPRVGV